MVFNLMSVKIDQDTKCRAAHANSSRTCTNVPQAIESGRKFFYLRAKFSRPAMFQEATFGWSE